MIKECLSQSIANQEDPSPDMEEQIMNALIIAGGTDNPSKQILEQQSLLVADDHDVRERRYRRMANPKHCSFFAVNRRQDFAI